VWPPVLSSSIPGVKLEIPIDQLDASFLFEPFQRRAHFRPKFVSRETRDA
jgi:hypothetical protein